VQNNIAAFGGDPDNITTAGFSAGGMSIGNLLGMPLARGRFHKAINRSGAANVVGPLDSAVKISEQYLKIYDLNGKDVNALRELTMQQLLDGQQQLGVIMREAEHRATPFQPVVDGKILPEWPIEAIKKGSAKGVTIMAGNALDELKAMNAMDPAMRNMDEAGLFKRLNDILPPDLVPGLVDVYRDALKKRGSKANPADILGTINTDLMFRMSTVQLVEAQRDNGMPAYNYLFTYKSPAMGGVLGAMHGLDNPFLFGCLDADFTGSGPEMKSLAVKIQDSCIAFTRTGDPSCKSIGRWPVYGKDRMTMILDKETRVEAAPYEVERRAWDKFNIVYVRPM
jgi:para-nitrobenzyl esterase